MTKSFMLFCVVVSRVALGERPAHAQGRDSLWNGAVIGAAVGAGAGIAFAHTVRDSDTSSQYAHGALIFGALGASIGLGVDALLDRSPRTGATPPRVLISPTVWRDAAGVRVRWRW